MPADILVPNRHQEISNHHADPTVAKNNLIHITLHIITEHGEAIVET